MAVFSQFLGKKYSMAEADDLPLAFNSV